jgi:hypothetical protein
MTNWARHPLDTPAADFLTALRTSMPVSLVATPRASLQCRPRAAGRAAERDPELADFDQVPLTGHGERIEAVFVRGEGVAELHEGLFMAADAPLLSFLETADLQRFRFLVEDGQVSGLVTISDLQRLPVYSVLFGLVVATEMLLMDWIRKACREDPDAWLKHLHEKQRGTIESYWKRAQEKNLTLDRLSCASLGHELTAACGLGLFTSAGERHQQLKGIEQLRNLVCHAMELAPSPEEAEKLPAFVRTALALIKWLPEQINQLSP